MSIPGSLGEKERPYRVTQCSKKSLGRDGHGLHFFNKYVLSAILEAGGTSVNKISTNPCPH